MDMHGLQKCVKDIRHAGEHSLIRAMILQDMSESIALLVLSIFVVATSFI